MSLAVLAAAVLVLADSQPLQPNPPAWPASVRVFGPDDDLAEIQAVVAAAYAANGGQQPDNHGQFSQQRFAFLFQPGEYNVEVPVGFYTQVAGLGASPWDVVFTSAKGVFSEMGSRSCAPGALDTFWRSAENFRTQARFPWAQGQQGMLWAVSQAAPLRRVIIDQDLMLFQTAGGSGDGYASGGFMANLRVSGTVWSGTQQQFFSRNCDIQAWQGGVWNMVFAGVAGAPASHCGKGSGAGPYVTVDQVPMVADKPFITIGADGQFFLNVPPVKWLLRGTDYENSVQVGFEQVYVAAADRDTAETINARLAQGLHVVLSPGVYNLDQPLMVGFGGHQGQVLLGLGLATLVAMKGTSAVEVGPAAGIRIAGLILEAGPALSPTLLSWGLPGSPGEGVNPGFLHDIFLRVGGPAQPTVAQAEVMLQINSGFVVGDNLWLWRADHNSAGAVTGGANPCQVGLVVNGNDVTMYGLAVEHMLQDLVRWNGERGATYFFQAELPYDVTVDYGNAGYTGYRVAPFVQQHKAFGVGVYHNFRDAAVIVNSGIVAPPALERAFVSPLSVYLNGRGTMRHIVNAHGGETSSALVSAGSNRVQWLCACDDEADKPTTWSGTSNSSAAAALAAAGSDLPTALPIIV